MKKLILLLSILLQCNGQWTWISGTQLLNQPDVKVTQGFEFEFTVNLQKVSLMSTINLEEDQAEWLGQTAVTFGSSVVKEHKVKLKKNYILKMKMMLYFPIFGNTT
jgi:hypothetical protein